MGRSVRWLGRSGRWRRLALRVARHLVRVRVRVRVRGRVRVRVRGRGRGRGGGKVKGKW